MKDKRELTEEEWDLLDEAARKAGKPRRELLREVLGPILGTEAAVAAAEQKKRRLEAFAELDQLPVEDPPDDGLCASVDHDNNVFSDTQKA